MIALILSALAMTLIVAVRYLMTSGLFAAWTARRFPGRLAAQGRQIRTEIGWSLASAAIYGVPAGIVAWGWQERGWTRIYSDVSDYSLWVMPASLLVYLLIHDGWFYWTHRLMHRPWWYKRMHAVHHASRPPTAWAALSFHPWEAISGALVIPALVFLVPIHVAVLGGVLAIMTLMGVTNHMGWEMFPARVVHGKLGKWLITASHHELHHQKYRCNYGLYFRHWDHLFGTDRGLGEFGASVARSDADRNGHADGRRQPSAATRG